jgi:hypothetical protein
MARAGHAGCCSSAVAALQLQSYTGQRYAAWQSDVSKTRRTWAVNSLGRGMPVLWAGVFADVPAMQLMAAVQESSLPNAACA